jgi:NADPH2:quinone reductase
MGGSRGKARLMRGVVVAVLGQPPEMIELDDVDGLRIEAVALNPLDIAVGSGVFYGGHPDLPYIPGSEAVGRRDDGTLVYLFGDLRGIRKPGFLAERVEAPEALQLELPADADPALALAAGIAGIAGWVPVSWKAKVRPGDRVLVLGARGAVGQIAVQAAKLLGAENVVGAGRHATGDIVALGDIGDALGSEGFTVCIDPVWGQPLADALAYAAVHARVVHIGQSAAPEAPLRSAVVRGKELKILGP